MVAQKYYSNGKFLITGEYLVLKGAKALAVPLKFGQTLEIHSNTNPDFLLRWKASAVNKFWFEAILDIESLEVLESSDLQKAKTLSSLLKQAKALNPKVLRNVGGFDVHTNAGFDITWGLGSSSTLISNVAKWFRIDPFRLHFKTSSGSGYDIACANADGPIFYSLRDKRPLVETAGFNPDFSRQLYFVYLGNKQQSHQSIKDFSGWLNNKEKETGRISEITGELISKHDLEEFEFFIEEHEQIMSAILGVPTVKETTFAGFPGSVKLLGAWGGDFVMMSWRGEKNELIGYLDKKGMETVFGFDEIVLV